MTARWTGGGAAGDLADPANWECRDAAGAVVEGAVPNEHTTVIIVAEEEGEASLVVIDGKLDMAQLMEQMSKED